MLPKLGRDLFLCDPSAKDSDNSRDDELPPCPSVPPIPKVTKSPKLEIDLFLLLNAARPPVSSLSFFFLSTIGEFDDDSDVSEGFTRSGTAE